MALLKTKSNRPRAKMVWRATVERDLRRIPFLILSTADPVAAADVATRAAETMYAPGTYQLAALELLGRLVDP